MGKPETPALSTARVQEGFSRQVEGEPNYRGEKGLAQEETARKAVLEQISPAAGLAEGKVLGRSDQEVGPCGGAEKPGRGEGYWRNVQKARNQGVSVRGQRSWVGLQLGGWSERS